MALMNVATYGYTMIAARLLGPATYGGFAAMMNLLLVVSVVSLGLQATAARRISADPAHVHHIEDEIMRVTRRAAVAIGVVLVLAAPLIDRLLRLDDLPAAALVGLSAIPLTMMGGQAGILQGERRWQPLAAVYLASGLPRVIVGTGLILLRPTEFVAILGVGIGMVAPVIVGWFALRHREDSTLRSQAHEGRAILRESIHNTQALFAFFALSNADIIVARNVLGDHDAGLYAGGIILTKAVLFLPQFVVVVAFPSMSTLSERRRALTRSLALVAVLGAVGTAAAYLLSPLAMVFVGGQEYAEVESRLWLFAVLGTALSMLQLLVYSVLARQGIRTIWFVWLGLVALVGAGLVTETLEGLLTVVVGVDLVLLAVLLAISFRLLGRPDGARVDVAPSAAPAAGDSLGPAEPTA